jgi:SAM-dependent methyltransferase
VWTEADSALFREIAPVAVPRLGEMTATIVSRVPFAAADAFRAFDLGAGDGALSAALLDAYPQASLVAFDGSASMREAAAGRLAGFGDRARVRPFDLATLDWWDLLHGAGLVVSSLCIHHLNDAKKQYLYKAVADRLAPGGALLIADLIEPLNHASRRAAADDWDRSAREQAGALGRPQLFARFEEAGWNLFRHPDPEEHTAAIFHQLVWLKHAGFNDVECFWMFAGHAVFGGFK